MVITPFLIILGILSGDETKSCSQDRIRTYTIEKTNFIRFFGMVNIFNVMSHGPINQSPITRLPIPPPD